MAKSAEKTDDKIPADIRKMSFEQALEELETIVRDLEDGSGALDESITAYERGAALKAHCARKLKEARTRIEKIVVSPDGAVASEDTDLGD